MFDISSCRLCTSLLFGPIQAFMWSGVFLQTGIWLHKGLRLFTRALNLFICHDNFSYKVTKLLEYSLMLRVMLFFFGAYSVQLTAHSTKPFFFFWLRRNHAAHTKNTCTEMYAITMQVCTESVHPLPQDFHFKCTFLFSGIQLKLYSAVINDEANINRFSFLFFCFT